MHTFKVIKKYKQESSTNTMYNRLTLMERIGKTPKKVLVGRHNERLTEYQRQYKAKQQIKKFYGNMSEKELSKFLAKGQQNKNTSTLSLIERKLEVVVFRLGFAKTITEARGLINAGKILVNGKVIKHPKYQVENGSHILTTALSSHLAEIYHMKLTVGYNSYLSKLPSHLYVLKKKKNKKYLEGIFIKSPLESEIGLPYKYNIDKLVL